MNAIKDKIASVRLTINQHRWIVEFGAGKFSRGLERAIQMLEALESLPPSMALENALRKADPFVR